MRGGVARESGRPHRDRQVLTAGREPAVLASVQGEQRPAGGGLSLHMNQQRWLRGDDGAGAFDWRRSARDVEVPAEIARALYARAMRQADDAQRAEALYLRWLRDAAALRRAVPAPVPGRRTQVMQEAAGRTRTSHELAALGPGKWTRSLLE